MTTIEEIHESLVNGQKKQMVTQIKEYGLYDFWADYKEYLDGLYAPESAYNYFWAATSSYFRITETN